MKKFLRWTFWLGLLTAVVIIISHNWVKNSSKSLHHSAIDSIPTLKTALILGTIPNLKSGAANPYFTHRINMAIELYKSGKVKQFVLSGDNHIEGYDEPEAMRQALIAGGIPDSVLFLDYAGFRTFDSVIRLKAIFGQDSAIVVSQEFHNERAVFIANKEDIYLFGADANNVGSSFGRKTMLREYIARVKCVLDLYVLNTEPKFYGERVLMP